MTNIIEAIFDDTISTFKLVIIGFVFLVIIGALMTIPGTPSEAKVVAEQTSNSISGILVFVIGLPSVGVIVAVIYGVMKKFEENNSLFL